MSPFNVVLLHFELPVEHINTPILNGGEGGGMWIVLFSKITPFEDNVSTISLLIEAWVK